MEIIKTKNDAVDNDTCYRCIERMVERTTGRKPGNSLLNDIVGSTNEEKQDIMFDGCCKEKESGRCDLERIDGNPANTKVELAGRFCRGAMRDIHRI